MAIDSKRKRILNEENRLRSQFSDIDENKKNLLDSTIKDAAFCSVEMEELRDNILRDGVTAEYRNGCNQYGTKQSADSKMYLEMARRLSADTKILLDCMPKTAVKAPDDHFDEFVSRREKM